jgi:hypothetical protein
VIKTLNRMLSMLEIISIGLAINLSDFRQLTPFGVFWCLLTSTNVCKRLKMRRLIFCKRLFSFNFVRLFVFQMKKDVRKRKKMKLNEKRRLKILGDAFFIVYKRQLTLSD